jgi:uncharacterized membrane protein YeiH
MDSVFFVLEFIGTIAFAISGAMRAIKHKMDVFGVCVLGTTTAVGGGIIRDLLLGITPPSCFITPIFPLLAIAVSLLAFVSLYSKTKTIKHKINDFLLLIADSVGLGVFTVIGIKVCYYTVLEPSVFLTICCGVITSVGGGVIRDIMSKTTPQIFVKYFYACSSIIGAIVCIILWFIIGELPAMAVGIFTIVFLRILAVKRRWKLPKISY